MFSALGLAGGCGRSTAGADGKGDHVSNLRFSACSAIVLAVLVCCGAAWAADAKVPNSTEVTLSTAL